MDETWKKLLASEWKKKVVKWKFINIYINGFKTKLRPISCNSTYTHFKYTFHFTWDVSSSYYFWHGVGTPKVSRALDVFEKALGGRESNGVLSGILDSARGLRPLLISSACCWVRGCRSSPPLPALGSRAEPMKIIVKKAALNHHFSWSQGNLGEGWYCIYFSSYTGGDADRKRLCPLGLLAYEQDGTVHGEWTGDKNRTEWLWIQVRTS